MLQYTGCHERRLAPHDDYHLSSYYGCSMQMQGLSKVCTCALRALEKYHTYTHIHPLPVAGIFPIKIAMHVPTNTHTDLILVT